MVTPLTLHVFPEHEDIAITELTQIDIKECLSPIWKTKNETASKALSRLNIANKTCRNTWHRCGYAIGTKSKSFIGKIYSKYSGYAMERSF